MNRHEVLLYKSYKKYDMYVHRYPDKLYYINLYYEPDKLISRLSIKQTTSNYYAFQSILIYSIRKCNIENLIHNLEKNNTKLICINTDSITNIIFSRGICL